MSWVPLVGGLTVVITAGGLYRVQSRTRAVEIIRNQPEQEKLGEEATKAADPHSHKPSEVVEYLRHRLEKANQQDGKYTMHISKVPAVMGTHRAVELCFPPGGEKSSTPMFLSYIRSDGAKVTMESVVEKGEKEKTPSENDKSNTAGHYYAFSSLHLSPPAKYGNALYVFLTSGLRISNTFDFLYYNSLYFHRLHRGSGPNQGSNPHNALRLDGEEEPKKEVDGGAVEMDDNEHNIQSVSDYYRKVKDILNENHVVEGDHISLENVTGLNAQHQVNFYGSRTVAQLEDKATALQGEEKLPFNSKLLLTLTRPLLPREVGVFLALPSADDSGSRSNPRRVELYAYTMDCDRSDSTNAYALAMRNSLSEFYLKWLTANMASKLEKL